MLTFLPCAALLQPETVKKEKHHVSQASSPPFHPSLYLLAPSSHAKKKKSSPFSPLQAGCELFPLPFFPSQNAPALENTKEAGKFHGQRLLKKWFNLNNNFSELSADEGDGYTKVDDDDEDYERGYCMLRKRNPETLQAQYIDAKDIRICVGTCNVGGEVPHDDLDIEGWLATYEPADMYVLGFQEIVPLNVGNIFGVEDSSPVSR